MTVRRPFNLLGPALGLFLTALPVAHAQVTQLSNFQEDFLNQTGPTTTADQGYFFSSRVFLTNTTDATSATLVYPGTDSPATLSPNGPALLEYDSPKFPTQADLLAAFPLGTYTATTQGGTQPSTSASINYTGAAFPNVPVFTATTFSGAQNLNAAQSFPFSWNAFSNPTNDAFVFFTVSNATTGTTVFSGSFLSSTTVSQTLPAGTLTNGVSYTAVVDFSNRIDDSSNGISTFQGFDRNTSFNFTAAPEPSPAIVLTAPFLGLAVMALMMRRRAG